MEFCCSNWTISGFCNFITERNYVNWRIITVGKCPNESQFDFRRFLCFIICWVSGLIPLTFCQINIQLFSVFFSELGASKKHWFLHPGTLLHCPDSSLAILWKEGAEGWGGGNVIMYNIRGRSMEKLLSSKSYYPKSDKIADIQSEEN